MFTSQQVMDSFAWMYATDPWERVAIRLRAFALARRIDERDWYPRLLAYAERVVAEELAVGEPVTADAKE